MNWPHIHLMINHFPVIGLFLSVPLLLYALFRKSGELERTALIAFVVVALSAAPVYFTGREAEDFVKRLPGATEGLIGAHEEIATYALALMLLLGAVALGGLVVFWRSTRVPRWFLALVLALAFAASGVTGLAANAGGMIRHPEIRGGFAYPPAPAAQKIPRNEEKPK